MKTHEVLNLLDQNLDEAAAKCTQAVDVGALKQLVGGLRRIVDASTAQIAAEEQKRMQMSFENWLETNKQRHEWKLGRVSQHHSSRTVGAEVLHPHQRRRRSRVARVLG